jgi:hypothetical protein
LPASTAPLKSTPYTILPTKESILLFALDIPEEGHEVFSSVPRLPAWSFLRLIYGGVFPPPHSPDKSGAAASPTDKS